MIEENILYGIRRMDENIRAFNKIIKLSALDREAATRLSSAINGSMGKMRLTLSYLGARTQR